MNHTIKYLIKIVIYALGLSILLSYVPGNKIFKKDMFIIISILLATICAFDLVAPCRKLFKNGSTKSDDCPCAKKKTKKDKNKEGFFSNKHNQYIDQYDEIQDRETIPADELVRKRIASRSPKAWRARYEKKKKRYKQKMKQLEKHRRKMKTKEVSEMKYSQLPKGFHEPLGSYDATFNNKFEHGYTYLHTDKWQLPEKRPPVCVTQKKCPICPSITSGYPLNLKEWNSSRNVMKDNISLEYTKDILNEDPDSSDDDEDSESEIIEEKK